MAKLILEKVLEQKKISKRQFAFMIKADYPTTFRYYRPGYDPKLSSLEKWAKALKVKIRDLIKE
jgi:hypothetical protein